MSYKKLSSSWQSVAQCHLQGDVELLLHKVNVRSNTCLRRGIFYARPTSSCYGSDIFGRDDDNCCYGKAQVCERDSGLRRCYMHPFVHLHAQTHLV